MVAACSGGGGVILPTAEPGTVSCEALTIFDAFRYHSIVTIEMADRGPDLDPQGDPYGSNGYRITWDVDGAFHRPDDVDVLISFPESDNPELRIVEADGRVWQQFSGTWTEQRGGRPAVYEPLPLCQGLAPDLDLDSLAGRPESVGDIPATKYTFEELPSQFASRSLYFGPQSDFGRLIQTYDADVWVADEGSYIVKMDLQGTGSFENGRQLHLRVFTELQDINDGDIKIVAPVP